MNKILIVARKVKDLTVVEMAKALEIQENEYKELEYQLIKMTPVLAEKLGDLFNIAPDHFMANEYSNMEDLKNVLEKHRNLLDAPEYNQGDGRLHLAIAKMGLEAAIATQQNCILLRVQRELEGENHALRELYNDLKEKKLKSLNRRIK